jgi:DNA-binding CsgD family transcriptional regulator
MDLDQRSRSFNNEGAEQSRIRATENTSRADGLEYEDLLMHIYCGVHQVPPWNSFLQSLQRALDVSTATLVLRQPSDCDGGVMVSVGTNEDCETRYRKSDYKDDPFLGIPTGYLFTLNDVIAPENLQKTAYYNGLLNDARVRIDQMLAIDIDVPVFGVAKLRMSRRRGMPEFSLAEKSLFVRMIPHLEEALGHYARNTVMKIESSVYSRALNQLLMGVMILDQKDEIICCNEIAETIVTQSPLIEMSEGQIHIEDSSKRSAWNNAIRDARAAFRVGSQEDIGALRLSRTEQHKAHVIQLLVRPFSLPNYDFSTADIGLAVFISDGAMRHILSRDVIRQLFGLTRAESMLVLKLCDGLAVGQAAFALNISTNTARSQLRSVYEKTGAHRLSELIGLIFNSTANLG